MGLTDRLFKFREMSDEAKPFLAHIEDLRMMIIKMTIALGLAMILSFCFRVQLFAIIQHPLMQVDPSQFTSPRNLGPADPLSIPLEMSFYAGIVISFPFLLYFLGQFVLPALTVNERRHIWPAATIGFGLFLAGVLFAYFVVLPQALAFFYNESKKLGWDPTWAVREYFSFASQFVIAFGLAFELPVVVLLLVKLGVVEVHMLRRLRPQALVAVMIFAAVLTPTTDMVTMLLMGGPMYLLYELCIIIAAIMQRREKRGEIEIL
ncbi:MAG: twin-arginine translocase subunit TatC [Chthoniobacterales bacterium]